MKQAIKHVLDELEGADGPSSLIDQAIAEMIQFQARDFTSSIDDALALELLAPGWCLAHAGDNAIGVAGSLRAFGHTVEYTNGVDTVQGDAPTKPLAYCLAIMKAYLVEWSAAEKKVQELIAGGEASESVRSDILNVVSNIVAPFDTPEAEIDQDDGTIILRWSRERHGSFSLTFVGKGSVSGYLLNPEKPGKAWKLDVHDSFWLKTRFVGQTVSNVIARSA
jgi:hypothetical protein